MSSYMKPPWAKQPAQSWELLEIKSGIQVRTHPLDKDCILFGRAADQVDIAIAHESASRLHARIAFDRTGVPWLKDLGSTHGVTVNKKRLPQKTISKTESNSNVAGARGVIIYPGDILQFGASTRIYVLEGPPEFARGSSSIMCLPIAKAEAEPEPEPAALSDTLTDETVPEQYWKEWENLKSLKYKLENIKNENERIQSKVELTPGQEKQLQANEDRADALSLKIKEQEELLYSKVFGKTVQNNTLSVGNNEEDDDDDVDDFYDRTKGGQSNALETDAGGETEESLSKRWRELRTKKLRMVDKLQTAIVQVDRLQETVARQTAAHDEESFFSRNELQIAKDTVKSLESEIQVADTQLVEIEKLLKVVNPKIQPDIAAGTLHPNEKKRQETKPVTTSKRTLPPEKEDLPDDGFVLPTPVTEETGQILPNPISKTGPSMPPPLKRPRGPMPPPSFSRSTAGPPKPNATTESRGGQVDTWQAPKDQDGSGITKLNKKFAGRY